MKKINFVNGATIDGASTFNTIQDNVEEVFNGEEPMGSIVVEDVVSKNLFDKSFHTDNLTYSGTGEISSTVNSFIQEVYIPVSSSTQYTFSSALDITGIQENKLIVCEYNSSYEFIERKFVLNSNSLTITTSSNTNYVRLCSVIEALNYLQFEKGTQATSYTPYKEFSNEVQYLTNFITAKSGYTIKSQHIFKQNNHFWGNVVIQKNSGTFGSTTEAIATLPTPIQGNVNSGCFMSQGEWSAKNVGYLYIGNDTIQVSDPNATTNNVVKINIDVVTNATTSTQSASMMSSPMSTTPEVTE